MSLVGGGFSLVEFMVAMTIGLLLVLAAIAVYTNSRAAYTVNDTVARLQENARYAMQEITRDLRLAGYWGHNNSATYIANRTGQTGALAAALNDCAAGWYTDLDKRIEGLDNVNVGYTACIPDTSYLAGTDILAMRFVDPTPVAALQGATAYLRSNRSSGRLFVGTVPPVGITDGQNYRLESRAYFVSPFTNTPGDGIPALKRAVLGAGPQVQEEVVVAGVQNLQVQYAVDIDGNRSVDRYLNAAAGAVSWDQVKAVRIWLLVRAETAERGYVNNTGYQLAQGTVTQNDEFRRVLIARTVQLHN